MHGFIGLVGGNARFNRYNGCVMHGSTGMMGAGYKVLLEWLGGMHGSTGMMGANGVTNISFHLFLQVIILWHCICLSWKIIYVQSQK